jgi:hypothetical protein
MLRAGVRDCSFSCRDPRFDYKGDRLERIVKTGNAQKSTGPRTPEGKAASSFNALKHGIDAASTVIPGEDPAEYERLAAGYRQQFNPQSPLEEFHVSTLIRCDWQKRRLQRTEAKLYRALLAEGTTPEDLDIAILRDSPTAKLLQKVFSQIASLDRSFFRAVNDLRRIDRERQDALAARRQAEQAAARARRSASFRSILQNARLGRLDHEEIPDDTPLAPEDAFASAESES